MYKKLIPILLFPSIIGSVFAMEHNAQLEQNQSQNTASNTLIPKDIEQTLLTIVSDQQWDQQTKKAALVALYLYQSIKKSNLQAMLLQNIDKEDQNKCLTYLRNKIAQKNNQLKESIPNNADLDDNNNDITTLIQKYSVALFGINT